MKGKNDLSTLEVDPKKAKKYKIFRIIIEVVTLSILTGLLIWVLIKYLPYFLELSKDKAMRDEFITKIKGYGPASFFIVLGLQIFQVIFMIIPSGPIVIASGVVLNPLGLFVP